MTPSPYRQSHQEGGRLADLIEQLRRLPRNPITIPVRVQLCQRALEQVRRKDQPELWARLHSEMGLCLKQAPTGDPADNLEQAIEHYEQALEEYTPSAYFGEWVATMHNLAVTYTRRIRGDQAENQEKAITLHKGILQTCTLQTSPAAWALSHYDLGRLYAKRIEGDQAANCETAIDHCQQALKVWTSDRDPVRWAKVQDLLGTLYRRRLLEDPAENLEKSLRYLEAALEKLEPKEQTHAQDWARVHHNLGTTLFHRIRDNRADNLEKAITHFEKALKVRTRQAFPTEWAETQHNLAAACIERQRGDRAKHIDRAIELLEAVLKVRQREKFPVEWAMSQNVLGIAYLKRIHGERAENLERAIDRFEKALQEQEQVGPAEEKASTQHNLAIAYSERLLGDRIKNLEMAAKFGLAALETLDRRVLIKWATIKTDMVDILWKLANLERQRDRGQAEATMEEAIAHGEEVVPAFEGQPPSHRRALAHYNLGNAYSDRIQGDRADNQEKAIEHYKRALDFYTIQNFPSRWANTHNNLGVTYWERVRGNRGENLEEAICHFDTALEVFEPDTFPVDARRAARNRGNLHFEERCWSQARAAYATAVRAAEVLYRASYSPGGKEAEIVENTALYERMVQVCLEEPDYAAAMVAAEGGKARTFLDQMGQAAFPPPPNLPLDLLQREEKAIKELRGQEQDLAALSGRGAGADRGREPSREREIVERRRKTLAVLEAVWDEITCEHLAARSYVAMRRGEPMTWDGLCDLAERLGPEAALVEFYTLPNEIIVFVLRAGWEAPRVHRAPVGQRKLHHHVVSFFHEVAEHPSYPALNQTWQRLAAPLLSDVLPYLKDAGLVYLIPEGLLHYLPLHALEVDGAPLVKHFPVAYAPSAAVLGRVIEQAEERATNSPGSALVVGNPTEDLSFAESEAQIIAQHFGVRPYLRQEATKARVLDEVEGRRNVHLACHGDFRPLEPLQSGIVLHDGVLTAQEILALRLQAELLVLSACQTAQQEVGRGDELVGLTRALLYAEASSLVVSLWSVNDRSTGELMRCFYDMLYEEGSSPRPSRAEALRQAILDIRHQPRWEHPYYWAPFILVGGV